MAGLTLISKLPSISPSFLLASRSAASRSLALHRASPLLRYRPLLSLAEPRWLPNGLSVATPSLRCFSTRPTTSSLNDPSPNWSNRPPKETILLDGCDFEHWLVVMEPPDPNLTRDEIIDSYIKTLSQIVGSEDEARMKIYSVSTKHYFAFGALISEELSYKMKTVANVRWVLPDSYLDVRNKDYGGEPFIDGKAVPYDPKYHEEWVRNNARANERSRRNDRPRNYDRSRNFERRRENMQTFQNRDAPPNQAQNPMPPRDGPPMPPRDGPPMPGSNVQNRDMPPVPPNRDFNAAPPRNMPPVLNHEGMPNTQSSYIPNRDGGSGYQGGGQGYQGGNPGGGIQGSQGYQGGNPGGGMQGGQGYQGGNPGGGVQGGQGYQGGSPGGPAYQGGGQGYQPGPGGGPGYQGGGPGYQGGSPGYQPGGPGYQGGGPGYQPGAPGYQGGGPGYQRGGPGYQGGGPSYQPDGPANQGGGPGYQGGGPGYQGRDIPGRD